MPDSMINMMRWLRDRFDEQQHWNEGTGIAAWLTYLDGDGKVLDTQLASATEVDPDRWSVAGLAAVQGM